MPEQPAARGWKVAAPFVLALCGVLLVVSANTSGGTDLRGNELLEMPDLVREEERNVQRLAVQVEELQEDVDRLTESQGNVETKRIQAEIDTLRPAADMSPVEGPGLTVTLDDAPRPAVGQELRPGTHVEDYLVHQQDIEAVMNALWAGGAEAMMVMDQRIGATSTVRCIGSTLMLKERNYSPPYHISAIGDPEQLQAALDSSAAVDEIWFAADTIGLGYDIEVKELVTMPAFESAWVSESM